MPDIEAKFTAKEVAEVLLGDDLVDCEKLEITIVGATLTVKMINPVSGKAPPMETPVEPVPQEKAPVNKDVQRAGIICSQRGFHTFLEVADAEAAAASVRQMCGIASRKELATNETAAKIFRELAQEYDEWLNPPM